MHSENRDIPTDDSTPIGELTWLAGGEVEECSLLLRFFGDDLEPDKITALLGVAPTTAARKSEEVTLWSKPKPAHTGMWLLDCERTDDTPDNQVQLLFGDLADELSIWTDLAASYTAELKCHLFLKRWNRGTIFLPETMSAIAARHLSLNLDIYASVNQPD